LLIGIIYSASFGNKAKLTIAQGESGSALGYSIKFVGTDKITPREERADFEVSKGQRAFAAFSTSKETRRGNDLQYVRTPFIKKRALSDLYLSLENLTDDSQMNMQSIDLKLGDSVKVDANTIVFAGFDSDENARRLAKFQPITFQIAKGKSYTFKNRIITFDRFDMGQHQGGLASKIGASLIVEYQGKATRVTPTYEPGPSGEHSSPPVEMPGGGTIALSAIKADVGAVQLTYSPSGQIPDIRLGTVLSIKSGEDTMTVMPVFDPATAHGHSLTFLPDSSQLFLIDINAVDSTASYILLPTKKPILATIEFSNKPMINLVWLGFLTIVFGTTLAVVRRMKETGALK
jgi:hypothetical protein